MKPFHIKCLLASLLVLSFEQAIAGQPRVPKPIYLEGEILVRYRAQAPAAGDPVQKRLGLTAKYSHSDGRTQLLRLPAFTTVESMLPVLRQDSAIELAEPNFLRFARTVIPNDTLFSDQWGLRSTGQANFLTSDPALASVPGADMNLVQAWDANNVGVADRTGSSSVVVAVIDDAVQTTHPDFAANIVPGHDFVNNDNNPNPDNEDESHGTSVTGCIGAIGNNGLGVAGVAWNVKLMPLKFGFDTSSLLAAMDFVARDRDNGAKIVNMSFGGPGFSKPEQDKINELAAKDILFVAAHGNDDSNTDLAQLNYPANYDAPNILSVAATNRQDNIASFSQYGPLTADVAAPGLQIVTTAVNGGYTNNPGIAGTSFSAPYAAGAAALIRSHVAIAGYQEIRARLIESGNTVSGANSKLRTSGGRIDVDKALDMAPGPALILKTFTVDPSGNQTLDPAESVMVTIVVENLWQAATGVSATLSADNGITVSSGAQNLGNIPAQGTASASFLINVPTSVNDHRYVNFRVSLTAAGGYSAERAFLSEIGRLQNGIQITQNFSSDLYDEYHAWHVDIANPLAGSNTLVIRSSTPLPDRHDVDLLVKKGVTPKYSITVGVNPEDEGGFFCTSGTHANCQDPETLLSARADGNEGITVENPTVGTYHMVLVNYEQTRVNYTLKAEILPGDLRPNAYTIPEKSGVALDSLVISDPFNISGITAPTFISIEPAGEYSIDNGAFTSSDGTVGLGSQLRLRLRSDADADQTTSARVNIGGVESEFVVRTAAAGGGGGGGGGALPSLLLAGLLGLRSLRTRR